MALTKVTKSGLTDNAVDASKIEDGTIVDADITPGTITNAKLAGSIANDKLANSSITINGSAVSLGGSVTGNQVQMGGEIVDGNGAQAREVQLRDGEASSVAPTQTAMTTFDT